MDGKEQPPPQYAPPQYAPPQQPQGFNQPQTFNQQQGFNHQYVVNQPYPVVQNHVYTNQGYVIQQGFPVQNQFVYSTGQPNVIVTQPTSTIVVNQRPSDFFVCSLLTCLFCFFPTGIAALVYSCKSKNASDRNDYIKGRSDGNMAKIFSIVSLCVGLLWLVALMIFLIIYFTVLVSTRDHYNDYGYSYDY